MRRRGRSGKEGEGGREFRIEKGKERRSRMRGENGRGRMRDKDGRGGVGRGTRRG